MDDRVPLLSGQQTICELAQCDVQLPLVRARLTPDKSLSKSALHTLAKTAFTRSYAAQSLIDGWVEELDTYFVENDFE